MHGMGIWGYSGLSPFGTGDMLPHPWARVKGPLGATQMQCNGDKGKLGLKTTGRCLAAEPS
eukprot:4244211-Karenia_brevis.AAC.1